MVPEGRKQRPVRLHESERTCDGRELKRLEHAGPSRNGRLEGFWNNHFGNRMECKLRESKSG